MNRFLKVLNLLVATGMLGCGAGQEAPGELTSQAPTGAALSTGDAADREGALDAEHRPAKGSFTCDFGIPTSVPAGQVPPIIERDRMYMAARPGLIHKQLPLRLPGPGENLLYSGGRYLFDTAQHAREYRDWVFNEYNLDGVLFLQRPYFVNPDCHAWTVIGEKSFGDLETQQTVVRVERWQLPDGHEHGLLRSRWHQLVRKAREQNLSAVWLLYSREEKLASVVYFGRPGTPVPQGPDFAALGAMEQGLALGDVFADLHWNKVFDRTSFVWTLWYPFQPGDHGKASVWPNSPPLPAPYAGDGVCEVSRGENSVNAPTDCPVTCGNGVADPGETSQNCPGDVRIF